MKQLIFLFVCLLASTSFAEETVGEKVGGAARDVKDGVVEGLHDLGDFISDKADAVGKGAQKAANKASETASEFVEDVKEGYEKAGD
ncbi:MAG: hypothetical protein MI867_00325 [Pseudomonadales bacterium]|nr:hypothetical protein [Pseudomonadales bacterium]